MIEKAFQPFQLRINSAKTETI